MSSAILLFLTLSRKGKISDLENSINRVNADQETAQASINSLLNEIDDLNQKISDLENKAKETQTNLSNILSSLEQNKTDIDSVKNALDNAIKNYQDNKYNCEIIFLNHDGSLISKSEYKFGDKITSPATPTKASDNTYDYVFAGWYKAPDLALDNTIFVATYTPIYREYKVKFINLDNEIISEEIYHYGDTVIVPEYFATKESEEPNSYEYILTWDKTITTVVGDITYTAVFEQKYIDYVVRFVRDDGSLIEEKIYRYNDIITMETPTKESTETYTYTFKEWDKEFDPVTEATEYKAIFEAIPIPATEDTNAVE